MTDIVPSGYHPAILFGPRHDSQFPILKGKRYILTSDTHIWYPVDLLRESVDLFLGAPFRSTHPDFGTHAQDWGRVIEARWDGRNVRGVIEIRNPLVSQNIAEAVKAGQRVEISPMFVNRKDLNNFVVEICSVDAVDLTPHALTGARFLPHTQDTWQRTMEEVIKYGTTDMITEALQSMPDFSKRATENKPKKKPVGA